MGSSRLRNPNQIDSTGDIKVWLNDIRCKKINLKRKRHVDLRVAAILTSACFRAEEDIRKKQQERLFKWSQLKMKLDESNLKINSAITPEQEAQKKMDIDSFWNEELNELDQFLNSLNQVKTVIVR